MSTLPVSKAASTAYLNHIAQIQPSSEMLCIDDLLRRHGVTPAVTPGNVGLCLSGGGSRAMCAGMGQLRGLMQLQLNGASVLSQIKAISTVSGGSWVGQTYSYLADSAVSDQTYLGPYIDPANLTAAAINTLAPGNLGNVCNHFSFSSPGVLLEAILLMHFHATSPSMVWQIALGNQLLSKYGLYTKSADSTLPASFFTYNEHSKKTIAAQNPSLTSACNLLADALDPSRDRRPFPICNMSMKVKVGGRTYAAPVQSTPLFTGIVGDLGVDDDRTYQVGGGGVTSFAFNSILTKISVTDDIADIEQSRPWSLTDAVGTSSAAIAAAIWTVLDRYQDDPAPLQEALTKLAQQHPDKLASLAPRDSTPGTSDAHLSFLQKMENGIKALTHQAEDMAEHALAAATHALHVDLIWNEVKTWLEKLPERTELVPKYQYWPVRNNNAPVSTPQPPHEFGDGGFLENTGIGGMLAYRDIDALLVFVNSEKPMTQGGGGIFDGERWLEGTKIMVDDQIPCLFGYFYSEQQGGYVRFDADNAGTNPTVKSQLFPAPDFAVLLRGLWQAANGQSPNFHPATFLQTLTTVANPWFGVAEGKSVKVLWSYLNPVQSWYQQLPADMQPMVANTYPDWAKAFSAGAPAFPNFSTVFQTELSASQVNLMSNLTAWCVAGKENEAAYLGLFK